MARIKRQNKDHLLVGYRPSTGSREIYWRCRNEDDYANFCALEDAHRSAGTPVPDPVALFGEVPRRRDADQGREPRGQKLTKQSAPLRDTFTLAQWVGNPHRGDPGPYFENAKASGDRRKERYQSAVDNYAGHIKHRPMDQVNVNDAALVRDKMLVCPACVARAEAAGKKRLLARAPAELSAVRKPWDGSCVDEEGISTHYALLREPTVESLLVIFRALWGQAINDGRKGREPRVRGVTTNPFAEVKIGQFPSRPSKSAATEALSHAQLSAIVAAMPDALAALVLTCAHGLMRPSEVLGMSRSAIRWPDSDTGHGQAVISIEQVYVKAKGGPALRSWGKTPGSTREPIWLSALATEALRAHVQRYCSTPNPERCDACRAGSREHGGKPGLNPHRGCDFANGSPIWRNPTTGKRIDPKRLLEVFKKACDKADLTVATLGFQPTVKLLRATGTTLLIEAGVENELVRRIGRWTNVDTMLNHYNRVRDDHKAEAVRTLDERARAELGLPGANADAGATPEVLSARLKSMVSRCGALEAKLREMGIDPDDACAVERVALGRRSRFGDDDRLREIIRRAPSRKAILDELGVSATKKNYLMLARRAEELGVELPQLWAPQRNGKSQGMQAPVSVAAAG